MENVASYGKSARPVGEEGRGGMAVSMMDPDGMNGHVYDGLGSSSHRSHGVVVNVEGVSWSESHR